MRSRLQSSSHCLDFWQSLQCFRTPRLWPTTQAQRSYKCQVHLCLCSLIVHIFWSYLERGILSNHYQFQQQKMSGSGKGRKLKGKTKSLLKQSFTRVARGENPQATKVIWCAIPSFYTYFVEERQLRQEGESRGTCLNDHNKTFQTSLGYFDVPHNWNIYYSCILPLFLF